MSVKHYLDKVVSNSRSFKLPLLVKMVEVGPRDGL